MKNNQIILSYPDSEKEIRTVYQDSIVYFSLSDVVATLAAQNTAMAESHKADGLMGLIKAQNEFLEEDECKEIDGDSYITEPGLFRIILRDNSAACKRFQRWVLHEVLPSIQKYGTYPAPLTEQGSEIKRVVQSLLLEIEEREKLEKKTKEQFLIHETKLNDIGKKLASISTNTSMNKFISVNQFCAEKEAYKPHAHKIFGWAIKVTSEDNEPTTKRLENGVETLLFPEHVLVKASSLAMEHQYPK